MGRLEDIQTNIKPLKKSEKNCMTIFELAE